MGSEIFMSRVKINSENSTFTVLCPRTISNPFTLQTAQMGANGYQNP